jgi:hypothetical protein
MHSKISMRLCICWILKCKTIMRSHALLSWEWRKWIQTDLLKHWYQFMWKFTLHEAPNQEKVLVRFDSWDASIQETVSRLLFPDGRTAQLVVRKVISSDGDKKGLRK